MKKGILTAVVLIHSIFLLMILFGTPGLHNKKEHKPLIVRSVTPKVTSPVAKSVARSKDPKPQTASAPTQKKVEPPKPIAKKQTPEPKAPVKKTAPSPKKEPAIAEKKVGPAKQPESIQNRAKISDSLIKELEESIAKIENKSDKTKVNKIASPIALQIDAGEEGEQSSYTDTLTSYLYEQLSLPDYGEVKIQLSLRQDGTVAKLVVLKAKNGKNRDYLEKHLPRLRFPPFVGELANQKEHTFVLTFCNEN
jgi:hypothetical protein